MRSKRTHGCANRTGSWPYAPAEAQGPHPTDRLMARGAPHRMLLEGGRRHSGVFVYVETLGVPREMNAGFSVIPAAGFNITAGSVLYYNGWGWA